jgi:hypothetical protein
MIKTLLVFFILLFLNIPEKGSAQRLLTRDKYDFKKLVTVPAFNDSSGSGGFCICRIVKYTYRKQQRTDAIFVSNPADTTLSVKELVRSIDRELQQALWFFDSYKVIGQYVSPVNCNSLFNYLKSQHGEINRSTFITASYIAGK